jgi:predicted nucleic acid-binding protein
VIFLDANFFLRWLVAPVTADDVTRNAVAVALFACLERGDAEATTSEAVLMEIAHVMTSKRQYGVPVERAVQSLAAAVRLRGLTFPPGKRQQYLRALEIWADRPALGFVDALTAAMVENSDNLLATFDSDFEGLPGIEFWRPDNGHRDDPVPSEAT